MRGDLDDAERLLQEGLPEPRPEFAEQCAAALFGKPSRVVRRRAAPRARPLLTAGGVAASLAMLLLVLGIAGQLPFGFRGEGRAKAEPECGTTVKIHLARRPALAVDEHGDFVVRQELQPVRRPVKACR
jgi:hypothetical protein